jgi:hypothetical protein
MTNVLIRQITAVDYSALAEFLTAFPGDGRNSEQWLQRFLYWWEDNPAFDENWVRGFVMLDVEMIVGFVGSFPTWFRFGKTDIKAFNGTTWRVLEGYRNYSIDLWIKNREISNKLISFNTTPTGNVIKLIEKIYYKLLPWGNEQESIYMLKPAKYLKQSDKRLYCLLSLVLAAAIHFAQHFRVSKNKGDYTVKPLTKADDSFDHLWEKTKNRYLFTNIRTSETVNWYSQNKLLVGVYNNSELYGYAILSAGYPDLKELFLADLWIPFDHETYKVMKSLVLFVLEEAEKRDCVIIRFPHFNVKLTEFYKRAGLLQKRISRVNYCRIPVSMKTCFTEDNSYFTMLQGDYGI